MPEHRAASRSPRLRARGGGARLASGRFPKHRCAARPSLAGRLARIAALSAGFVTLLGAGSLTGLGPHAAPSPAPATYASRPATTTFDAPAPAAVRERLEAAGIGDISRDMDRPPLRTPRDEHADEKWVAPTSHYDLTARFGDVSGLWSNGHTGLDFSAPAGTPVVSVASGTVTRVGYVADYGNRVVVKLRHGTTLWYCHLLKYRVQRGERVHPGQRLGAVGATGNVTGSHLHFEVHPHGGKPVNPFAVLVRHGVRP